MNDVSDSQKLSMVLIQNQVQIANQLLNGSSQPWPKGFCPGGMAKGKEGGKVTPPSGRSEGRSVWLGDDNKIIEWREK